MAVSYKITDDEVAILSTALVCLTRSMLVVNRGNVFIVRCTDGKKRKISKEGLVNLIEKTCVAAGYDEGKHKEMALQIAGSVSF